MTTSDREWITRANDPNRRIWPTIEQYAVAERCGRCGASGGEECDVRWGSRRFHASRIDKASAHFSRDVGKAPWPEDREPGRCYCTIDPCPLREVESG